MSVKKLVIANVIFFAVVIGGIMMVSGRSIFDVVGLTYWAAKSKDKDSL